jgi:hypothetical protein
MADLIVDVVLAESGRRRNVLPRETEEQIKRGQADAWESTW